MRRNHLTTSYILYIGRIEPAKGCAELFDYYMRLEKKDKNIPELVLIGYKVMDIPHHPKIKFMGFLSENEKYSLLKHSKFLVMPSPYESLSLVTLESMACGVPVLVNGNCTVLKGHCIRSNAGLWYTNYAEFEECMYFLLSNTTVSSRLGQNGIRYIKQWYQWNTVKEKFGSLIKQCISGSVPENNKNRD